jgi:hypothetical protein
VDISKGRKSEHVEDRTTALGDLFYRIVQAIRFPDPGPGPSLMEARANPAVRDRYQTANRYHKLKTGTQVANEDFDALMRASYQPNAAREVGYFKRNANPQLPPAKPLSDVAAAHFPWQEDRLPLNRDEGRIYTHTGPTRRPTKDR